MSLPTEREFQRQVIQLARLQGWLVAHFWPARTASGWRTPVEADGAGFPDLILVRQNLVLVAELKSARGRVSPDQRRWLDAFAGAGIDCRVWRPSDWPEIERTLKGDDR